jgi:hypothetical protein
VAHRIRECVGRYVERRVLSLIDPCPHSRISTKMQSLQMWCEFSSGHGEEFQVILFAESIEGTSRLRNPKLPARGVGLECGYRAVLRNVWSATSTSTMAEYMHSGLCLNWFDLRGHCFAVTRPAHIFTGWFTRCAILYTSSSNSASISITHHRVASSHFHYILLFL